MSDSAGHVQHGGGTVYKTAGRILTDTLPSGDLKGAHGLNGTPKMFGLLLAIMVVEMIVAIGRLVQRRLRGIPGLGKRTEAQLAGAMTAIAASAANMVVSEGLDASHAIEGHAAG